MVQRERVTEDIFVFTSELYVQVTAGVIVTSVGAVVVDTLLYPEETRQIRHFIETRLKLPVRYVINTHHHADHTMGTCFFESDTVVAHRLCRAMLDTRGRESLQRMQEDSADLHSVQLVLPDLVFDESLTLKVGNKTLRLQHSPGHSPDSIVCWVEEDHVLFAADTVMPIPYFVDGDYDDFLASLEKLRGHGYENIVQGHGEVILRGEVEKKLQSDLAYLHKLRAAVEKALQSADGDPQKLKNALGSVKIGACGKSHVLLNGAVEQLHSQNMATLAKKLQSERFLQMK